MYSSYVNLRYQIVALLLCITTSCARVDVKYHYYLGLHNAARKYLSSELKSTLGYPKVAQNLFQ